MCTAAEAVGKTVYISGPMVGDHFQVRLSDPTDAAKMPVVGFVVKKLSADECIVQQHGQMPDVLSGLSLGRYNAQEDGDIHPSAPAVGVNGYAHVQAVGYAVAENVFFIQPSMDISIRRL